MTAPDIPRNKIADCFDNYIKGCSHDTEIFNLFEYAILDRNKGPRPSCLVRLRPIIMPLLKINGTCRFKEVTFKAAIEDVVLRNPTRIILQNRTRLELAQNRWKQVLGWASHVNRAVPC